MSSKTTRKMICALIYCTLGCMTPVLRTGWSSAVEAAGIPAGLSRDDVLFYASYDKGEAADVGGGEIKPIRGAGGSKSVPGRSGAAREFTSGVTYSAAKNISAGAGSIAFWVSSKWEPSDGKLHLLLDWMGKDGVGHNRILFYKYAGRNNIYFGVRSRKGFKGRGKVTCTAPTKGWNPGQWRHLVGTWDSKTPELRLYVDGRLASKNAAPWAFGDMPKQFYVGGKGTILDDLLILKRALPAEEARSLYAAYFPSLVPNGGFEEADKDGRRPKGWSGGSRLTPGRKGGACLRLDASQTAAARLKLKPGALYKVRFWAKVETGTVLKARLGASAPGKTLHTLDGPADWTECVFAFVSPRTPMSLSFHAQGSGSVCVDDVAISLEKDPYANMLRHSSFEQSDAGRPSFGRVGEAPSSASLTDPPLAGRRPAWRSGRNVPGPGVRCRVPLSRFHQRGRCSPVRSRRPFSGNS